MIFGRYPAISKLETNYFAFDTTYITYIHYYETTVKLYAGESSNSDSIEDSSYNMSASNIKFSCFLQSMDGYEVDKFPYDIKITCTNTDSSHIKVQIQNG